MSNAAPTSPESHLDTRPALRVASNGFDVIAERPYSAHPGDHYLSVVLARSPLMTGERGHREWVTWTYNAQSNNYSSGHYFPHAKAAEAFDDFLTRGVRAK